MTKWKKEQQKTRKSRTQQIQKHDKKFGQRNQKHNNFRNTTPQTQTRKCDGFENANSVFRNVTTKPKTWQTNSETRKETKTKQQIQKNNNQTENTRGKFRNANSEKQKK